MYLGEGAQEWTNYRAEMKMMLTGGVDGGGTILPETGDPIGFWVRGQYQDSEYEAQWVSGYYVVMVGASNRQRPPCPHRQDAGTRRLRRLPQAIPDVQL